MSRTAVVLVAGLAALAALAVAGAQQLSPPEVVQVESTVQEQPNSGISGDLVVHVRNPNPIGLDLEDAALRLRANGLTVGTVALRAPTEVAPGRDTPIELVVDAPVEPVHAARRAGTGALLVEVDGTVEAGFFGRTFAIPIRFEQRLPTDDPAIHDGLRQAVETGDVTPGGLADAASELAEAAAG